MNNGPVMRHKCDRERSAGSADVLWRGWGVGWGGGVRAVMGEGLERRSNTMWPFS